MKAVILAAGEGQRLRPLTLTIPKCLVMIGDCPLLQHWLDKCAAAGVSEVLINIHYLADKVKSFLDTVRSEYDFTINCVYEETLTGTGGFIRNNMDFIADEKFFFFAHGDNFSDIDLSKFKAFHEANDTELSVALFETNKPRQCGIAEELDRDNKIIKFVEKPDKPLSNLASGAMFMMSPKVVEAIPANAVVDFSKEVLPLYQGRMYGFKIDGFNIDVGTPDNYKLANKLAGAAI